MIQVNRQLTLLLITLFILALTSAPLFAQSDNANPRAFGLGKPVNVQDLPKGKLRKRLLKLPAQARGQAMTTLQALRFTELDVKDLRVDGSGGVYFIDSLIPEQPVSAEAPVFQAEALTEAETFMLHSRPGSSRTIYLDFDGHTITGTWWNTDVTDTDPPLPIADWLYAKPFDTSGNDVLLTSCARTDSTIQPNPEPVWQINWHADELVDIHEIWHRIAEDFAPFDIDVTTEEPSSFDQYTGRLLFTDDTDSCTDTWNAMPAQGAGGVAYVVVFGETYYPTLASPALVFFTNLGPGFAPFNAEAGSHEFGHNLGLAHDGSTTAGSYYPGHGSADTSPVDLNSWAPIMGGSYYRNVTQWSKGDYPNSTRSGTYQDDADDLNVINLTVNYRVDDHGDTIGTASALTVQGTGVIAVTNPEDDPHDFSPENKGVIEDRLDVDLFYFDTGPGAVNITLEPAWAGFYQGTRQRGANLDIEAKLMDGSGSVLDSSDPLDDTSAALSATLAAGRYYISVDGVGNPGNINDPANENFGYDDYASLGMYFISGTVQPTSSDIDAPAPNPMTWAVAPAAVDSTSITMTATTAVDPSGPVEYNFICQASTGTGCVASGWQTSTLYVATGLSPNTLYTYVVRARDAIPNTGADSDPAEATTDNVAPNAPGGLSATAVSQIQINVGWTDNSDNETGFKLFHSTDDVSYALLTTTAADTTSYSHTSLTTNTTHYYKVSATNTIGDSAEAGPTNATTWDTPPAAPTSLGAVANGATQIDLGWTDNSGNENGFAIQRSPNGTDSWAALDSVGTDVEIYSDTGLDPLSTWHYRVRASNSGGDSAWTNVATATTTDAPPSGPTTLSATAVSAGQIDLVWADNSANETGFEIERSDTGSNPWVQIDTVGTDVTSYQNTGLAELTTYYYRVNATGSGGDSAYSNTANAATLEGCSASRSFTANQWYQFSLACNPSPNGTMAEVFEGFNVEIYRADALNRVYIAIGPGDQMVPGVGYFVAFDTDANFTLNGFTNTPADVPLVADEITGKYNLVGFHGNGTISWADVLVVDGAQTFSIAEADPEGKGQNAGTRVCDLEVPTGKCLVSRKLTMWTGSQYETYDGETAGQIGEINGLDGIWVNAFKPGVTLRLPEPASGPPVSESLPAHPSDGRASGKGKSKKDHSDPWFIRLIAESGNSRDKGNVFGQHPGSVDGLDSHDLEERSPFGGHWLSILFTNPLFDEVSWGYTSDYRMPADSKAGEWPFVVRSSDDLHEITLRWQGKDDLFENAWLVNEQTGEVFKVEAGGSYAFIPHDGNSRFTFVIEQAGTQ